MMTVAATLVPYSLFMKELSPVKKHSTLKSSTESKIVAIYDKLGDILWIRHFLEAQGYRITANIVSQDNMKTPPLEENSRISNSKRTKHMKAKYFFIQQYYQTGEIDFCYCPTDNMWADILTKPLRGFKFHHLQAILMSCPVDYSKDHP
jgi:hypothetical protein